MGIAKTAEVLAEAAAKGASRRAIRPPLIAGKGLENFSPKVATYLESVASTNNGGSTLVYMKPSLVRQELGLAPEADDEIRTMAYGREYKNFNIDRGLNLDAETTPDGAVSFKGIDNPDLLRFFERNGDKPVPIVMRVKGGIPAQMPGYTAHNYAPIAYPHLKPNVASGSVVPEGAIKVPEDLASINNAPWISESFGPEFNARVDNVLDRDVQSLVKGIVYVNETRANTFGPITGKAFTLANKMLKDGASTKEVWNATKNIFKQAGETRFSGISTGFPDGHPRLEYVLPDFGVKSSTVDFLNLSRSKEAIPLIQGLSGIDDLAAVVPRLKNFGIGMDKNIAEGTMGYFDHSTQNIMLGIIQKNNPKAFPEGTLAVDSLSGGQRQAAELVLHELNHAVDSLMGFAQGGSWGQVAPEKFSDVLDMVHGTSAELSKKAVPRITSILNKYGLSVKKQGGLEEVDVWELFTKHKLSLDGEFPSALGVDETKITNYEDLFGALEKAKTALEKDPKLRDVSTLIQEGDYLDVLREKAIKEYKNIYGEEAANIATYRTGKYATVEDLRQIDPALQIAGRNKERNQTGTPRYLDPKTLKHLADEKFDRIQQAAEKRRTKTEASGFRELAKFQREER